MDRNEINQVLHEMSTEELEYAVQAGERILRIRQGVRMAVDAEFREYARACVKYWEKV